MAIKIQQPAPDTKFAPGATVGLAEIEGPATGVKLTTTAEVPSEFDAIETESGSWSHPFTLPGTADAGARYLHVRGRSGKFDKVRIVVDPTVTQIAGGG